MFNDTFVFALVFAAGVSVAGVWIIWLTLAARVNSWTTTQRAYFDRQHQTIAKHNAQMTERLKELEGSSPVKLAAELAELSEAVERLRLTHQRFAGRVSQRLSSQAEDDKQNETPEQTRARLRAEHGLPKLGGVP